MSTKSMELALQCIKVRLLSWALYKIKATEELQSNNQTWTQAYE